MVQMNGRKIQAFAVIVSGKKIAVRCTQIVSLNNISQVIINFK